MTKQGKRWGLAEVGVFATTASIVATLSATLPDSKAKECISIDDQFSNLFVQDQTLLAWPRKTPKRYKPDWPVSRRRGLQKVVTTLFNIHSHEAVPVLKGRFPPDEVLENLFRCRGFDVRHRVDPRLIKILLAAAEHFKAERVEIISAYRSPKFNDALAKKGRRVVAESRHTRGEAIDFSLSTAHATEVGPWLKKSFEGGVGIYSRNNFVHIDVGPNRSWNGK